MVAKAGEFLYLCRVTHRDPERLVGTIWGYCQSEVEWYMLFELFYQDLLSYQFILTINVLTIEDTVLYKGQFTCEPYSLSDQHYLTC